MIVIIHVRDKVAAISLDGLTFDSTCCVRALRNLSYSQQACPIVSSSQHCKFV
jgi:hypothetical protein